MEEIAQRTCSSQPPWDKFEDKPEFQELVGGMLEKDPRKRASIFQVSEHPWFSHMTGAPINAQVLEDIRQFNRKSEMEMQLAEMMLDRFNIGGLHHLSQAFLAMDHDMSGVVTAQEARQGVANVANQLGISPSEV